MLLAPLVLAVAVRLAVASRGDPLLAVIGLGVTAATLAAFAWAANLSSALMDRVLPVSYTHLDVYKRQRHIFLIILTLLFS